MNNQILKNIIIFICLFIVFLFIYFDDAQAAKINYFSTSVAVEAIIGEHQFTLYGYTSPKAEVTLEGAGIYDQTYSNDQGYFEFHNRYSPLSPREACLTAKDQLGRTATPTCLPPFPTVYNATIGPVLLPPTISTNRPKINKEYYAGNEIIASGQTIPNSTVKFSAYNDSRGLMALGLAKPVEAAFFPELTTKADDKGNYAISIPSPYPSILRFFSQTSFDNADSPKSNVLNLRIYPVWMMIVFFFLGFLSILKNHLIEIVTIAECLFIAYILYRRYLRPHIIAKNRALVLKNKAPLVKEELAIIDLIKR